MNGVNPLYMVKETQQLANKAEGVDCKVFKICSMVLLGALVFGTVTHAGLELYRAMKAKEKDHDKRSFER